MKPRALIAWLDKVLEGPPRLTGSYWEEKLGLGIEVNGAVAARHPLSLRYRASLGPCWLTGQSLIGDACRDG